VIPKGEHRFSARITLELTKPEAFRGSPSMRSVRPVALPIAGLLLVALHGHVAGAEIRLQGPADGVRVEADGATVAEILAALGERYAVRYRGAPGSRGITATFEGPLRRVLLRVLEGNDYVIKGDGDGLEVIVVSLGSPDAASPAIPVALVGRRDLRVQTTAQGVRVEAQGATVAEILAALGEHYAVRYRGVPASSVVTAVFEGPLRRVLVRVLNGNNYVIKGGGDGLEVIVVSLGSPAPTSPAVTATFARPFGPR
jgi:hypothetical protein